MNKKILGLTTLGLGAVLIAVTRKSSAASLSPTLTPVVAQMTLTPGFYKICVPVGTQADQSIMDAIDGVTDLGNDCFGASVTHVSTVNVPSGVTIARS